MIVCAFSIRETRDGGDTIVVVPNVNRGSIPASVGNPLPPEVCRWQLSVLAGNDPSALQELTTAGAGFVCFMTATELTSFQTAGTASAGAIPAS